MAIQAYSLSKEGYKQLSPHFRVREIAAGRDVAYWPDKVYTHLGNGLLTEDDIAEVEQLARAYYDALDAEDKANAEEITL